MLVGMKRIAALCLAVAVSGCDQLSPQWKGWVYPNKHNLGAHVSLGAFDTLEECRRSATTVLANFNIVDPDGEMVEGDYECGYKCKADKKMGGINVCEKTER